MSTPPYLAACVQAASAGLDTARTIEKARDLAADAARAGARLVLFPEAFIGSYPRGADFGATVGSRTPAGRDAFAAYHEAAIDIPGHGIDALAGIARENAMLLAIGAIERELGTLYCALLFFAADGRFLGRRRKLMPTAAERLVWGFGDGSTLDVHATPLGRVGGAICWENYMPLLRTALYAQGIDIWCAPTADPRPTWLPSMQHIALEGRCFVLSANQFTRAADLPLPPRDPLPPDAICSAGGSCIVDPLGNVLAGPLWNEEGIITAEIDLRQVARGRYDFDPVGHYARPDVFSLHVDTRAKKAVAQEK